MDLWISLIYIVFIFVSKLLFSNIIKRKPNPEFRQFISESVSNSSSNPDVKLSYLNKTFERLTCHQIWFWNSGKSPLRSSELIPNGKIIFQVQSKIAERLEVVDYKFRIDSNPNKDTILDKVSDNSVSLGFGTIYPDEGFLIELIHNGDKNSSIVAQGTFFKNISKESIIKFESLISHAIPRYEVKIFELLKWVFFIAALYCAQVASHPGNNSGETPFLALLAITLLSWYYLAEKYGRWIPINLSVNKPELIIEIILNQSINSLKKGILKLEELKKKLI
ncbi:hypothetical protein KAH55_13330 [bacterium]|nr:hypothetical protein [bacterium]